MARTHRVLKCIETALKSSSIPVVESNSSSSIAAVAAARRSRLLQLVFHYVTLATGNATDEAFRSTVNVPKRGIGQAALQLIEDTSTGRQISSLAAARLVASGRIGGASSR